MKNCRMFLSLFLSLFFATLGFSAPEDIESRFIYSDYSKRISMDFRDVALVDVLKIFSKQSGKNFISSSDVSGKKISLFLDNIPADEALSQILDANDLTYEMGPNSDVFIVRAKEKDKTITKVFPLKYASVSTSKIYGKDTGIKEALDKIKSKDGTFEEDSRTNSLIITDVPDRFPVIEDTIAKLDVPVLQILVEVEMLDVSKVNAEKIGITYGSSAKPLISLTGASQENLLPWDLNNLQRKALEVDSSGSKSFSATNSYKFEQLTRTPGLTDFSGVNVALDFIRSQTDTRSLARPKILILNNQVGRIEVGGKRTVGKEILVTGITTTNTQVSEKAVDKDVNMILEVTPQANESTGEIILKISPQVQDLNDSGVSINGLTVKDVETRKADSILKVMSGETIVLGGLLRTQINKSVQKVPFLGDLPMIGSAFRHNDETKSSRELIIIITPKILTDNLKQKIKLETEQHFDREGLDPRNIDIVNQQLDSAEQNNSR